MTARERAKLLIFRSRPDGANSQDDRWSVTFIGTSWPCSGKAHACEMEDLLCNLLTAVLEAHERDILSSGMPTTGVSKERLAEIWRFAGELSGSQPHVNVVERYRDLKIHIDVLEARMRDMAQDDVGQIWGGGYKAGFTTGATAQKKADLAAIDLAHKMRLGIPGEANYEKAAVTLEPIVQPELEPEPEY